MKIICSFPLLPILLTYAHFLFVIQTETEYHYYSHFYPEALRVHTVRLTEATLDEQAGGGRETRARGGPRTRRWTLQGIWKRVKTYVVLAKVLRFEGIASKIYTRANKTTPNCNSGILKLLLAPNANLISVN